MIKTIIPLLLASAVFVTPAEANWFSNPRLGVNLNVGSAPNPTPTQLGHIYGVEETRTVVTEAAPPPAPPPVIEPPAPPPPPPVAEAPPAPPPAVPLVRKFMVFFDFDKSNITPEAQQVISEAVKTAKQTGSAQIMVTGHTDTVGSFRYNQALSERRAMAVKNEMIRLGMNASITTAGRSFSDPLIPTGPGVREPQNRRAVIDLGNGPVASLE